MSIPVFLSRHTPDLRARAGYGAFVDWTIGERVTVRSMHGRPPASATIRSEIRSHSAAPEIDGAPGRGRWVREVRFDGEHSDCAVSAACIEFPEDA
jgi:hypothetical protein